MTDNNQTPPARTDQGGQTQGIRAAQNEAAQTRGNRDLTRRGGGGQGSDGNVGYTEAQGGGGTAGQTQGSNQGQNAAGQQAPGTNP